MNSFWIGHIAGYVLIPPRYWQSLDKGEGLARSIVPNPPNVPASINTVGAANGRLEALQLCD